MTLPSLLDEQAPRVVVAFPADKRMGHARQVAQQLAQARTNREADWILHRAVLSLHNQMARAGFDGDEINQQTDALRQIIYRQCVNINAKWRPDLDDHETGGAA